MDGSRFNKYDKKQLFTFGAILLTLLFLIVQLFVFAREGGVNASLPREVRTTQEKVQALVAARIASARIGSVSLAAIPDREYAAIDTPASAAEKDDADDDDETMSSTPFATAPLAPLAAVADVPPLLKGILQSRAPDGSIKLRAAYPGKIVALGERIDGYLLQEITADRVTLSKNGKSVVQQVASAPLRRQR